MVGTEGNLAVAAVSTTTTMLIVVVVAIRSLVQIHYHIFGCSVLNVRKRKFCVVSALCSNQLAPLRKHRPAISYKNIFWILEYVQTPVIKSNNSKDLL